MKLVALLVLTICFSQAFATAPAAESETQYEPKVGELTDCEEQSYLLSGRELNDASCLGQKAAARLDAKCNAFTTGGSTLDLPKKKWAIPKGEKCSGHVETSQPLKECTVCINSGSKTNMVLEGEKNIDSIYVGMSSVTFSFTASTAEVVTLSCTTSSHSSFMKLSHVCGALKKMGVSWNLPRLPIQKGEKTGKPEGGSATN